MASFGFQFAEHRNNKETDIEFSDIQLIPEVLKRSDLYGDIWGYNGRFPQFFEGV